VTPAATLRILVRDFESDAFNRDGPDFITPLRLQFSNFFVEGIAQGDHSSLERARKFFSAAMYGDCFIEWPYDRIPPKKTHTGLGAIEDAPEELLLLFRLFHPGDVVFAAVAIEKAMPDGQVQNLVLRPYRVISGIGGDSTRQFVLSKAEVARWEGFATELRSSPCWKSEWFKLARHFFLYGSSDEFNANFHTEVDRVFNYVAALEAALVPEHDFISRRLRERAVKLLDLETEPARDAKKLLNDLYAIRSTQVHGSLLSKDQMELLRNRDLWWKFEELVRELLVTSLKKMPSDELSRRTFLSSLFDPDDKARAEQIGDKFRSIKDSKIRRELLDRLNSA
jgi:hypothetical protein